MNYKLTNQELQTHKGFQWVIGKKEVIKTTGGELCSNQFFHYYSDPLLAIFLNPIHANIKEPRMFSVEVGGEIKSDRGLKFGAKEMTLVEELELPEVTSTQRIAFGILCALEVCKKPKFILWANNWLSGIDRSKERAYAAASAAYYAHAAAYAVAAAYSAAHAAAHAAYAAYYASDASDASDARAANYSASSDVNIDLIGLANKAMEY